MGTFQADEHRGVRLNVMRGEPNNRVEPTPERRRGSHCALEREFRPIPKFRRGLSWPIVAVGLLTAKI